MTAEVSTDVLTSTLMERCGRSNIPTGGKIGVASITGLFSADSHSSSGSDTVSSMLGRLLIDKFSGKSSWLLEREARPSLIDDKEFLVLLSADNGSEGEETGSAGGSVDDD